MQLADNAKEAPMDNLYEFDDIKELCGSQRVMASWLNVHESNVSRWAKAGKIPADKQLDLMRMMESDRKMKLEYLGIVRKNR